LPAVRRDPAEGERRITRLIEQSQTAMRELRAVLAELRPADGTPDETELSTIRDLPTGLDELLDRARDHGIDATLDTSGYAPQPPNQEQALYRICQEALSNVIKHARADHVLVAVRCNRRTVRLTVCDDGAGLPRRGNGRRQHELPGSGGMGLSSMRERAEAAGGRFAIRSPRGGGTRVEVTLPRQDGGRW
jgi:signal transduction histidine kinase